MAASGQGPTKSRVSRVPPRVWLGFVLAVIALAFVFQNMEDVTTSILVFRVKGPQWIVLLSVFVVGVVTGWLAFRRRRP